MRATTRLLSALLLASACATPSADPGPSGEGHAVAARGSGAAREAYAQGAVTLRLPSGWTASPAEGTGRVDVQGPSGQQALVWPVFLPGARGAANAADAATRLLGRTWPGIDWDEPEEHAGSVVLRGEDDETTATAILGWTAVPGGVGGVLYAVRAPEEQMRLAARTAQDIFSTLVMRGTGDARAPTTMSERQGTPERQRVVDPRERAFSVEVPRGWRVQGGMFRAGPVDLRPAVEARSPDDEIVVRLGDASIGTFVTGTAIGLPEGSVFTPGPGQQMTVRRYVDPATFAAGQARERPECRAFQLGRRAPRHDLTTFMNELYASAGLAVRLDAGEAEFQCGDRRGYALAVLQVTQMGGPAMWKVEYLVGYTAPSSREAEARQAAADLVGTFELDPGWLRMQSGLAGEVSRIVTRSVAEIARIANGGYWDRAKNGRAWSVAQSNATLGIEQVENAATGARYDVSSGPRHTWIDPQGHIVGTDTDAVPHVDFTPLVVVPPGS